MALWLLERTFIAELICFNEYLLKSESLSKRTKNWAKLLKGSIEGDIGGVLALLKIEITLFASQNNKHIEIKIPRSFCMLLN